jgi:hypothetical protein
MANSPILGIVQMTATQSNKHTNVNDAVMALERAANDRYTNTDADGANITLSESTATRHILFDFSGATANKDILFPSAVGIDNAKRFFAVRNNTSFVLTVKATTGTGSTVPVPAGSVALIHQNYEDMRALNISLLSPPYDISLFYPDVLPDGGTLATFTAARPFSLADDFAGSVGHCAVNPSSTAVLEVQKNGTPIGTITISTGGGFTFATTGSGPETFTAGQRLSVVAPSPDDATLADVSITFLGTRT